MGCVASAERCVGRALRAVALHPELMVAQAAGNSHADHAIEQQEGESDADDVEQHGGEQVPPGEIHAPMVPHRWRGRWLRDASAARALASVTTSGIVPDGRYSGP